MLEKIIEVVKVAGTYAKSHRGNLLVSVKDDTSLVTNVDVAIEDMLKTRLSELCPQANFLGEESGGITEDITFIIDPIDGTNNYIKGIGNYAISVAYGRFKDGIFIAEIGVVYDCVENKIYYAKFGEGSWVQNQTTGDTSALSVTDISDIGNAVIGFGFPYNKKRNTKLCEAVNKIQDKVLDMKRIGPSSADICKIAEGRLDGYLELDLQLWDIAGSRLILEEAGGVLSDWNGETLKDIKTDLIAGSKKTVVFILNLISSFNS
jgi:myo-inositol-1(or 4)-monophosphatase